MSKTLTLSQDDFKRMRGYTEQSEALLKKSELISVEAFKDTAKELYEKMTQEQDLIRDVFSRHESYDETAIALNFLMDTRKLELNDIYHHLTNEHIPVPPYGHSYQEKAMIENSVEKHTHRAGNDIDREAERLKFIADKQQYHLLLELKEAAEKEFTVACKNLTNSKPGAAREFAYQNVIGTKTVVDELDRKILKLESTYSKEKLTADEHMKTAISNISHDFLAKVGSYLDLAQNAVEEKMKMVQETAAASYKGWEDWLHNTVVQTKNDIHEFLENTTLQAAAAISLISDIMKDANEKFNYIGAAAYSGMEVKARDISVAFTEKSIQKEKELFKNVTHRKEEIDNIIDKANRVKETGHQFKNSIKALFGMKETLQKDDISKDNPISQYLNKVADKAEKHIKDMNQELAHQKNMAYKARANLLTAKALLNHEDWSKETELPEKEQNQDLEHLAVQIGENIEYLGMEMVDIPLSFEEQLYHAKEELSQEQERQNSYDRENPDFEMNSR